MDMRKIIVAIMVVSTLLVGRSTWAQTLRIPFAEAKTDKLVLKGFTENLLISGYSGNEIIVQRDAPLNQKGESAVIEIIDKAASVGLRIIQNKRSLELIFDEGKASSANYMIRIPNKLALKITSPCNIRVTDITNEVEIVESKNVQLTNITGSAVVSGSSGNVQLINCAPVEGAALSVATISGNILVNFNTIASKEPIMINSISGDVIVELPAQLSANFKVKSISGTIRSDFKFPDESRTINQELGDQINYQTSDNNPTINITTVSGNILLRNR
jgi:hypothetical protein